MNEQQKQRILVAAQSCEQALRVAFDYASAGDIHRVHLWVEVASMQSDVAFRVAQA